MDTDMDMDPKDMDMGTTLSLPCDIAFIHSRDYRV